VVKEISYETTDANGQLTTLEGEAAAYLLMAATPKFAAQSIRKVHDLNWHPTFFLSRSER
jgi:branched-chain amino acid transport system substrate-binding protein